MTEAEREWVGALRKELHRARTAVVPAGDSFYGNGDGEFRKMLCKMTKDPKVDVDKVLVAVFESISE